MSSVLKLVNGLPRMVEATTYIYDQTYTVPSTITAGTAITLPASGTYLSTELQVYLNGEIMQPVLDYNYVGSGVRTQITMTFDLIAGTSPDLLRFRKEV